VSEVASSKEVNQTRCRTVHIDTSVQIERCKAPRRSDRIQKALDIFGFKSTSSYAKLEFKRAWLQRLSYLYYASQQVERDDELIGFINDRLGSHPGHRNRLTTCLEGIEAFLSRINESLSPRVRLIRLQSHIRCAILGAYKWWDCSVTHEYTGTRCKRASEQPREFLDGRIDVSIPNCRRNKIECSIHRFFEQNKSIFINVKDRIIALGDKASAELTRAADIIQSAEDNPEILCDNQTCAKLGDALIAVDGSAMECFAANNDKEWQLLSEVLGKELLNPVRSTMHNRPS